MTGKTSTRRVCFLLLLAGLVLSACGSLTKSDKATTTTWWLTPYTGVAKTVSADPVSLVSVTSTVVPGLDTDQILTLSTNQELRPYAGARWVESLPELASSLIERTLESSGRFAIETGHRQTGLKKCDLQVEFQRFFAELDSSGQTSNVRVTSKVYFQCDSEAPVRFSTNSSVPVNDARMKIIVAAFQQATDQTMQDMLKKLP